MGTSAVSAIPTVTEKNIKCVKFCEVYGFNVILFPQLTEQTR